MSKNAAFQCWIVFVTLSLFRQGAAVNIIQDQDRVYVTYNTHSDACSKLTTHSTYEAKEAANWACKEAFHALDRIDGNGNACTGWQRAECRQLLLPDFEYFQCSCKIYSYDNSGVRTFTVTAFRDCAWKVSAAELLNIQPPVPSIGFQLAQQRILEEAVEKFRLGQGARPSSGAGPSNVTRGPSPKGTSGDAEKAQGGSSSKGSADTRGAGSSAGPVFTSVAHKGSHVCRYCGRCYARKQILRDHEKSHETVLRCTHCKSTYSSRTNLNKHLKKYHKVNPSEAGSTSSNPGEAVYNALFACDKCGKSYQWRSSLSAHKITHEKDISCKICNSPYSSISNLRQHMRELHPKVFEADEARAFAEKPYECEECKQRFVSKRMLQEHLPVHSGETYCQECDLTFPRRAALRMHQRKAHKAP